MVVRFVKEADKFKKSFRKLDNAYKPRVERLIQKIIENPEIGKPMRYARKGTRELYISPFRISYAYVGDELTFLDLYHKDEQ